jgi:integrase
VAFFRLRCGKWQAIVSRKGYKPFSKTFISKIDAEKWARSVEIEIDRGTFKDQFNSQNYLFSDLITIYLEKVIPTLRGEFEDTYRLKKLLRNPISQINLSKLTPNVIANYRDERLKEVTGPTVKRELSYISSIINYGRRELNINIENPVSLIRKPANSIGRDRVLNDSEIERLLIESDKTNNWMRPLVEFALETAMRRGEMLSLLWININFEKRIAFLPLTKNGSSRKTPLSLKAITILKNLDSNSNEKVFPLKGNTVSMIFLKITRRVGLIDVHFHDLRHTAITRLANKFNILELAIISGHKSLKMLQRYTHIRAEDLVDKIN